VASRAQFRCEMFTPLVGNVAQEDMRAFPCHRRCNRMANTVGGACDDCGFSFETIHVSLQ
jgi:hypothetical protein